MNKLRKMIIERMSRVNECGGGYSGGCGGGYSGSSSSSGSSQRKTGVKYATAKMYSSATNAMNVANELEAAAAKAGKKMPSEMKQKLDALKKAAFEFVALIDMYTKA